MPTPTDCAEPGCAKPSRALKLCWAHYNKQRRAGRGAISREIDPDPRIRITTRSAVTQDGCWEWQHTTDADGYGLIEFEGRRHRAHRLAYEAFVAPIPAGLTIDHLCRNTRCVNPKHLEPVTSEENVRRAVEFRRCANTKDRGLADWLGVD